MPVKERPGPTSRYWVGGFGSERRVSMDWYQRTGATSCWARRDLMVLVSVWGWAVTLEMTGILGVLKGVLLSASASFSAAGCMNGEWKAPATLSGMARKPDLDSAS